MVYTTYGEIGGDYHRGVYVQVAYQVPPWGWFNAVANGIQWPGCWSCHCWFGPYTMHGQKKCHLGSFWNMSWSASNPNQLIGQWLPTGQTWSYPENLWRLQTWTTITTWVEYGANTFREIELYQVIPRCTVIPSYTPSYPSYTHVYEVILSYSIWSTHVSLHYTTTFLGPLLSRYIQL